ncbi:MAG: alpha/beta hydrolase family protein [Thermogutta sp.]
MRASYAGFVTLGVVAILAAAALLQPAVAEDDPYRVLGEKEEFGVPGEMMTHYLFAQVARAEQAWKDAYEARKTPEAIQEYQQRLKAEFVNRIGGVPERTPLNPQVVGTLQRRGYRVEKIIFESQPRHLVTAALFLPDADRYPPPYPAVLVPCGHSNEAKAYPNYAGYGALLATNGLAALVFDPIDQGERHQWQDADGKFTLWGTAAHNMVGKGCILLGWNIARYEIWDAMRAVDYLQSRPDILPDKIGCSGISGGGTQTAYLMALDPRILAAAPGCYICGLFGRLLKTNGPQDAEQNIFGQLAWGMDHADYCMMRAPQPTLLLTATRDYFNIEDAWASFRMAKRLYGRLGYPDRMELAETDQEHGFTKQLREASVRWMLRWLSGRDEAIFEPDDLDVPSKADLQCTPQGEVMLLPGARSAYDLNRDQAAALAARRRQLWDETPREALIRQIAEIAGIRPLEELSEPKVDLRGELERPGYRVRKLLFQVDEGVVLPALLFVPEGAPTGKVLYVHEQGKAADAAPDGAIESLVRAGKIVLAADLRGTGETQRTGQRYFQPDFHGPDGQDFYVAYLLGRSYVGMRAEDLMICARWLRTNSSPQDAPPELIAIGHVGIPALHAAAVRRDLFGPVTLVRPFVSWTNAIELGVNKVPLVGTVHGALAVYDLPDLAALLGDRLSTVDPRDALGRPAGQ